MSGDPFTRDFAVQQVDGEWRIADPPDGLVLLEPDFERVYDQLNAYFLDPTRGGSSPIPATSSAARPSPRRWCSGCSRARADAAVRRWSTRWPGCRCAVR